MLRDILLRLFGLSDIVARQAFEIDRLQMNYDAAIELSVVEGEILHKIVSVGRLWEPNDVY